MTADITPFIFEDHPVRTIQKDGEPWFVAKDVCVAIGIVWKGSDSTGPLADLDADEKGVSSTHTLGGQQGVVVISESGMYALVLRSRKALTPGTVQHRFRKWVTAELLPSIRKTGGYGNGSAVDTSERDYRRMQDFIRLQGQLLQVTEELHVLRKDRQTFNLVMNLVTSPTLSDDVISEGVGVSPKYVEYVRFVAMEKAAAAAV